MKKKLLILFLTVLLVAFSGYRIAMYIYSQRTAVMTGEIVYVRYLDQNARDYKYYNIYVKPSAERVNEDLIVFKIREDCSLESSLSDMILSDEPESAVGTYVEITYYEEAKSAVYSAKSIRIADENSPIGSDFYYESYPEYESEWNTMITVFGKVVYVAEMRYPVEGYLVYISESDSSMLLEDLFITNKSSLGDGVEELLIKGETGYNLKCQKTYTSPLYKSGYYWALSVELK